MKQSNQRSNNYLFLTIVLALSYSILIVAMNYRFVVLGVNAANITRSPLVSKTSTSVGNTKVPPLSALAPTTIVGKDGTWCRDLDSGSAYNAGICQDKLGDHPDTCKDAGKVQENYCTYSWNKKAQVNVRCAIRNYVCPRGIKCINGGCGPGAISPAPTSVGTTGPWATPTRVGSSAPTPTTIGSTYPWATPTRVGTTSVPTPTTIGSTYPQATPTRVGTSSPTPTSIGSTGPWATPTGVGTSQPPLRGSDGTWCLDTDINNPYGTPNAYCQDATGTYSDYCDSTTTKDYYCTYSWNGSSYTNVRCVLGGYVCSAPKTCRSGACL